MLADAPGRRPAEINERRRSVVNGLAADLVVGVEERLVQQVADVAAPEAIEHPAPVPASLDEAGEAQL